MTGPGPSGPISEAVSPAGRLSNPLLRRPETPKVKTGVKLSSVHSAYAESGESPNKQTIQTFQDKHATLQSEETEAKPHIKVRAEWNSSTESKREDKRKLNIRLSDQMQATTETEETAKKPHLKASADKFATKESVETKELNAPKLKGRQDLHATTETKPTEWRIKKKNTFGHVSQLSNRELVIAAPRLKRPEQIYHSLESESDFRDFGIKPKIRISKSMSATKETEEIQTKSKIKFSEKMHATKESGYVDHDQMRLEKFRQQNLYGHASDSSVERLLYGPQVKELEEEHSGKSNAFVVAVSPVNYSGT